MYVNTAPNKAVMPIKKEPKYIVIALLIPLLSGAASGFVFSHQEQTLYLNILVGRGGYFGFNERGSRGN